MTQEHLFREAFGYLRRYEIYRLVRLLGFLFIYFGMGFFISSWAVMAPLDEYLTRLGFLLDLPCTEISDQCEVQAFLMTMNIQLMILIILVFVLLVIVLPIVFSLSKTSPKDSDINCRRFGMLLGVILILFFAPFHNLIVDQIMWRLIIVNLGTGTPYPLPMVWLFGYYWGVTLMFLPILFWPMVGVGVGLYLLRKEFPKYDFHELRIFGYILVVLCVIDISFRTLYQLLVSPLMFNPAMIILLPLFGQFYWTFTLVILITYLVVGWWFIRRADQVLEGPFAKKGFESEGFDESGERFPEW